MSREELSQTGRDSDHDINDVLRQLDELEEYVSSSDERREVQRTRQMLEQVPGSGYIKKYTTRDVSEGIIGGIIFSLPLLVEDGVFEIAEWFLSVTVGPVPVFLLANILFIVAMTAGLLYATDIREIRITDPIFGFIPRRLVAVLTISFSVAAIMMFMWGRLHAESPTTLEQFSRITCIWAAAALGAALGDILPGESAGTDLNNVMGRSDENDDW